MHAAARPPHGGRPEQPRETARAQRRTGRRLRPFSLRHPPPVRSGAVAGQVPVQELPHSWTALASSPRPSGRAVFP